MVKVSIRGAELADVDRLVAIETVSFSSDRLSRRSFLWMLRRGHGDLRVAERNGLVVGYVLNLYHAATNLTRLYSIAVEPAYRRQGIGQQLLADAERAARAQGSAYVRLEARADDEALVRFYRRRDYHAIADLPSYYDDGGDAVRMEKRLRLTGAERVGPNVDYYAQTTEFTCGPASLMMAMHALCPAMELSVRQELRLWREATTIYMTSGLGGCGPHGLALAAHRRGFQVQMYVNRRGPLFLDGVRNREKKRLLCVVHDDFLSEVEAAGIAIDYRDVTLAQLLSALAIGGMAIVLISTYQFNRSKAPHWVLLTGADDTFVYLHDPEVDEDLWQSETDNVNIPVRHAQFERMAKFGARGLRAAVALFAPGASRVTATVGAEVLPC